MVPSFISTLFQQRYDLGDHLPFQLIRRVDIFHHVFGNIILLIFRLFPINQNKIVIANLKGSGYGCNPKYIAEILVREMPNYDLVWLLLDKNQIESQMPDSIKTVNYYSLQALYELATAKIWIRNLMCALDLGKRQKQLYIQTFHGSGPKKCGVLTPRESSPLYILFLRLVMNNVNIVLSNSAFQTKKFCEEFLYEGRVLEVGFPRNDILVRENEIKKCSIKDSLQIGEDTKIILYAPTFRGALNLGRYDLDYDKCLFAVRKKFGDKWVFLVRLHPSLLSMSQNIFSNIPGVIDVSQYPDMQELLDITDILITDYSSSMFDYAITRRPCFLYVNDIAEYISDRGLYMDLATLPFPIAETNALLVEKIESFDLDKYHQEIEQFMMIFGMVDSGNASECVVSMIKQFMT